MSELRYEDTEDVGITTVDNYFEQTSQRPALSGFQQYLIKERYDSSHKLGLSVEKRAMWDSGQHRFVFNVDRWENYTKQRLRNQGRHIPMHHYYGDYCKVTPKQRRRMVKKYRKNNDTSLFMGVWHHDG